MQNKTLTIMFVDMQGYTSLTSKQTREEHQWFVKEINSFIEKHVQNKHGNLIKTMGDGFLITFESPTDAITCGIAIQEEIKRRNANVLNENHWLRLRIGISTGEVSVTEQNDVYGEAVNIAARIEKFCEPNEIFISESTYLAMNRSEIKTKDLGPLKFKNVSDDVRVFKVLKDATDSPQRSFRLPYNMNPWIPGAAFVFLILIGLLIYHGLKPAEPSRMAGPQRFQQPGEQPSFIEPCKADTQKFCAEVLPGEGRIIQCLMSHSQELEEGCQGSLMQRGQNLGNMPRSSAALGDFGGGMPQPQNNKFEGDPAQPPDALSSRRAVQGQNLRSLCGQDIQTFCSAVQPGGGRMVQCLQEHFKEISQGCYESLGGHVAPASGAVSGT